MKLDHSLFALFLGFLCSFSPSACADSAVDDPFNTEELTTRNPQTVWQMPLSLSIPDHAAQHAALSLPKRALTLIEITDFALRNNPTTRIAWAQAKIAAAALGSAKSAYLPQLSGGVTDQFSATVFSNSSNPSQNIAGPNFSLSYVLLDFGIRSNNVRAARYNLIAADLNQNSMIQQVILQVQQAYYLVLGQQALVEANKKSQLEAKTSLDAAQALRQHGLATIGDVYQAQASLAQSNLNLQLSEGNYYTALGQLTTSMGLPADTHLNLMPLATNLPIHKINANVSALLIAAKTLRPDLQAAQAQVEASQAQLAGTKAEIWPTVQLNANANPTVVGTPNGTDVSAGITVSMPIFTGFSQTYAIRQAKAQVLTAQATRDQLIQQIALQVWQAYFALQTAERNIGNTDILLKSSQEAVQQALGQYKAGVGNILSVLTTQSSLAGARVQSIQARLNWYTALAQLAAAIGVLSASSTQNFHHSLLAG